MSLPYPHVIPYERVLAEALVFNLMLIIILLVSSSKHGCDCMHFFLGRDTFPPYCSGTKDVAGNCFYILFCFFMKRQTFVKILFNFNIYSSDKVFDLDDYQLVMNYLNIVST